MLYLAVISFSTLFKWKQNGEGILNIISGSSGVVIAEYADASKVGIVFDEGDEQLVQDVFCSFLKAI